MHFIDIKYLTILFINLLDRLFEKKCAVFIVNTIQIAKKKKNVLHPKTLYTKSSFKLELQL